MRTCQSCGRENPPDRDFCECGEYLRWEPTGFVQAVTPEMAAEAVEAAPPPAPEPAAPAPEPAAAAAPPPPPAPAGPAPTAVQGAVAPPAPEPPPAQAAATITLRLPDEDAEKGEALALGVHPGDRARVRALIRNQSGIVDNYQLTVEGMPAEWWTVLPDTVYLVPYGSGGTYEQEVEIHLHPPRSPEAEARIWELEVVAHSKAQQQVAAREPLLLGIQPFEEHDTKVKPERASGRRKANFKVAVKNKANAPVRVAFDASEADNDCRFRFDPPAAEIEPGQTVETALRVRPPKQIWIGRPHERRIDLQTKTGDEAAALEAAAADGDGNGGGGRGLRDRLAAAGVSGPQFQKPNLQVGPGGINVQRPMVRGPQARARNLNLGQLKMPGAQAPPAVTGPLLPTQAVFRQKAWLPWWVAIVVPLLVLLALALFLLLPKNVEVPNVVGKASAFEAEQAVTAAKLRLAPQTKEKIDPGVPPGTVLSQTPPAGESAEEGSEVSILVAVGDGKVEVPDLAGRTAGDAEKLLRERGLTLGQANPQPLDPKATIKSHIPAAKEVVQEGKPVDIFMVVPKTGGGAAAAAGGEEEGAAAGGGGGGGGGEGGPVKVPEVDGADAEAYGQKLADGDLVPIVKKAFDESDKGTVFRVRPAPGTEVEPGSDVTVFVSAGFPQIAFDNDKDVLRVGGAAGATLEPIAKGSQRERDPAWSADGSAIAFTSDGQVFLRRVDDPDASPRPLTKEGEQFRDLAFAPTARTNVLAMIKDDGAGSLAEVQTALCFGAIDGDGMTPRCKDASEQVLGRKVNWAPDGRSLLVFGSSRDGTKLGMVRFTSRRAFSPRPEDWDSKGFVTDVTVPGEGVIDAAPSPDGKQLAAVRLGPGGKTDLLLAKADDFLLADAEELGVRACKAIWQPDGLELVVVRSDACLGSSAGELIRLPVDNPKAQRSLRLTGDNPVFQPLAVE